MINLSNGISYPDYGALALDQQTRKMNLKQITQATQLREEQAREAERKRLASEKLGNLVSTKPDASEQEIYGAGGVELGNDFLKARAAQRKEDNANENSQFELIAKKSKRKADILATVTDQPSYEAAIRASVAEGLTSPEEAQQALSVPFNEAVAAQVKQQAQMHLGFVGMLDAEFKQAAEARAKAEEARKAELHPALVAKGKSDATAAEQKVTGTEKIQPVEQANLTATQQRDAAMERDRAAQRALTARGQNIQAAHYKAMESRTSGDPDLAQAVLDNPLIWETLTPSKRTAISATLAANGFEHFGRSLEAGAVKDIAQSEGALDQLNILASELAGNKQYLGPIAGWQASLPWQTEAKKVRAKLDLTRQNVGKALEGGVLRKEDEEKYKQILATMFDTPDLAESKIADLKTRISRDMEKYKAELRKSGRRVNDGGGAPPPRPSGGGGKQPRLKFNPATGMVE